MGSVVLHVVLAQKLGVESAIRQSHQTEAPRVLGSPQRQQTVKKINVNVYILHSIYNQTKT